MNRYFLAIDFGASSGRHILGSVENGKITLEEVYRFPNGGEMRNGHLCWNHDALFGHVIEGLKKCRELGKIPSTLSIDTWGVDFVLIDKNGDMVGDTVAYRDDRTVGAIDEVAKLIPNEELYRITGIQRAAFNTIYQLYALKKEAPEQLDKAEHLLFTPEYFNYLLTGKVMGEYTIASTSGMLNAAEKTWDKSILEKLGLPERIFSKLNLPGTVVGNLKKEIAEQVGFDCTVLLAPAHDTASAFIAVPARDDNAVYISSGTWSLLGVENAVPFTGMDSCEANITNEGGYQYRYRFLKNIMGMWIIQNIRHDLADKYSFQELADMAAAAGDFKSVIDVDDDRFFAPKCMTDAIKEYLTETSQPLPETVGELVQCVYTSLALCYKKNIDTIARITGRKFTSINIVGGGCNASYLNQRTADISGLPVIAGPSEGTAIGNILSQMIADGVYRDLADARQGVKDSFPLTAFN